MKKRKLSKLLLCCTIFLFFAVSVFACFFYFQKDSFAFRMFTKSLFISQLSQDTLSMHYSVLHPENYGIKSYPVQLPAFEESTYQNNNAVLENYIAFLKDIKPSKLDDTDALSYRILLNSLEEELDAGCFSYYDEPLSPGSGMQSQLPILLAEYTFSDKQDITDYLALLNAIPDYFKSIETYETIKAEKGLFMADYSAEKIIRQCDIILDKERLQDDTHFLITTFQNRIEEAQHENAIDAKEASFYLSENKRLLETVVLPSYNRLADSITLLKGSGTNEKGLCFYAEGTAYYTSLVKRITGSDKSINEIKLLLYQQLQDDYTKMSLLSTSLKSQSANSPKMTFPLDTPTDILQDLQTRILADFPPYPDAMQTSCSIHYVDESLSDFVSPAFYLTPPIDNLTDNSIYINKQSIPNSLDLYTTLAHEGYPGHLYQSVYDKLFQNKNEKIPVRSLLYFGGYTEGWAIYVENHAYEYAKEVMVTHIADTKESEFWKQYIELCRLDKDMRLCLYSLLDIAIHHYGIAYEDAAAMLGGFGIKNPEICRSIYEYIVEEPGNYLKYYLGYLEILECKEAAKTLWQTEYSDKKFHKFFLEAGPMNFSLLRESLTHISLKN